MKKIYIVTFIIVLIFFPGISSSSPKATPDKPRVLILQSYHYGFTWTDNINSGIRSEFADRIEQIELRFEFLDSRRIYTDEYFEKVKELFLLKYNHIQIDVIICADDHSLNFILQYGREIFKDVPIVFCSVSGYTSSMKEGREITGLLESIDIRGTIEVALSLQPRITEIVVITDKTRTGQYLKNKVEDIVPAFSSKVRFRFLEDFTIEELQQQVENLSLNSIVLLFIFSRDKAGRVFSHEYNLHLLSKHCPVPIYSVWEFYLGHGIIGGKLVSGKAEGALAARTALRILDGEQASNIPLITSPIQYMFDYQYLKRFGLPESKLPLGSNVINKPVSFYQQYKLLVWSISLTFVFLISLISFLTMAIIQRRRIEKQLIASLKEKETLLREVHHRVKNNLQLIRSLLNLKSLRIDDANVKNAFDEMKNRIQSMGFVHEKMYQSENFSNINFKEYLEEMLEELLKSFNTTGKITLKLDLADRQLGIDKAIPCGLIVNELVTNSLKHAFPGERNGEIHIHFKNNNNNTLVIFDNGIGIGDNIDLESTESLGLTLVKLLTQQLQGTITHNRKGGTEFIIEFPG